MCLLERAGPNDYDEARKLCTRAVEGITRKFGGKNLSFEQFVMRRGTDFARDNRPPVLPALELVFLFNGFVQTSKDSIAKALDMVEAKIKGWPDMPVEQQCVCQLIKASALYHLGKAAEAEAMLIKIDNIDVKEVKEETYTIPEARFALAVMYMERARHSEADPEARKLMLEKADSALKRLKAFKPDYNFKIRLHFRVHLAHIELKAMKEGKAPGLAGGNGRDDDADDLQDDKANENLIENMTSSPSTDDDDVSV